MASWTFRPLPELSNVILITIGHCHSLPFQDTHLSTVMPCKWQNQGLNPGQKHGWHGLRPVRPSGAQILQAQEEGNQGLERGRGIRVWKEEEESGMRYNLGICLAPGLDHVCWELLGNHLEITLQPFLLQAGCPQLTLWSMLCGWVCPHLRKAAWEPSVWEAQPSPHQVGDSQLALALPEV